MSKPCSGPGMTSPSEVWRNRVKCAQWLICIANLSTKSSKYLLVPGGNNSQIFANLLKPLTCVTLTTNDSLFCFVNIHDIKGNSCTKELLPISSEPVMSLWTQTSVCTIGQPWAGKLPTSAWAALAYWVQHPVLFTTALTLQVKKTKKVSWNSG